MAKKFGYFDYLYERGKDIFKKEIIRPIRKAGFNIDYQEVGEFYREFKRYDGIILRPSTEMINEDLDFWMGTFNKNETPTLVVSHMEKSKLMMRIFPESNSNYQFTPDTSPERVIEFLKSLKLK